MQSHRSDSATVWRKNEIRRRMELMVVLNHNWNYNRRVNVCTITMVTGDRMLVTWTVLATPGSYWSLLSKKESLQARPGMFVYCLTSFVNIQTWTNGLLLTACFLIRFCSTE